MNESNPKHYENGTESQEDSKTETSDNPVKVEE